MASNEEEYIQASEVARKFGVSPHTILRRVQEGAIFPGAKKERMSFGERWLIPKSVAESVTLKDISPKIYQDRNKNRIAFEEGAGDEFPRIQAAEIRRLEERISILEQAVLRLSMQKESRE